MPRRSSRQDEKHAAPSLYSWLQGRSQRIVLSLSAHSAVALLSYPDVFLRAAITRSRTFPITSAPLPLMLSQRSMSYLLFTPNSRRAATSLRLCLGLKNGKLAACFTFYLDQHSHAWCISGLKIQSSISKSPTTPHLRPSIPRLG